MTDDATDPDPDPDLPNDEQDREEAIRRRLQRIVADHSQATVARKSGTSQPNVSRYLKGRRIPAEFLSRLSENLQINPAWLLLGQGAPYLVDDLESGEIGRHVLDLAHALEVAKGMPRVKLVGPDGRQDLLDLRNALDRIDQIEASLTRDARPIFDKIWQETNRALEQEHLDRARGLLEILREVSRLARGRELDFQYRHSAAYAAELGGEVETAVELRRTLFLESIGLSTPDGRLDHGINFIRLLFRTFRLGEAQRTARALLALEDPPPQDDDRWSLRLAVGLCDLELGAISAGRTAIAEAFPRLNQKQRVAWRVTLLTAMLLEGTLSHRELIELNDETTRGTPLARKTSTRTLALHTLAFERVDEIDLLLERYGSVLRDRDEEAGEFLALQLEAVRAQLETPDPNGFDAFLEHPSVRCARRTSQPARSIEVEILLAQVARLAGSDRLREHVELGDEVLASDLGRTPFLALRIIDERNHGPIDTDRRAGFGNYLRELEARGFRASPREWLGTE